MKTKLTPEQLTEAFFTYKWKYTQGGKPETDLWYDPTDSRKYFKRQELPPIHKSLDLQEIWVWPELRKKRMSEVTFYEWEETEIMCVICDGVPMSKDTHKEMGKTKAIAQLTASLKALGVEI